MIKTFFFHCDKSLLTDRLCSVSTVWPDERRRKDGRMHVEEEMKSGKEKKKLPPSVYLQKYTCSYKHTQKLFYLHSDFPLLSSPLTNSAILFLSSNTVHLSIKWKDDSNLKLIQNGHEKWHYASKWDVEIHRDTKKWSQNSEKVNYTYSPLKERSLVCGLFLARYRGTLTMLQQT